jgi:hypothetical protein
LEDIAIGAVPEVEDPLHAEDVLPLGLEEFAEPGVELLGVQFPVLLETDAGHGRVMGVVMPMMFMDVTRLHAMPLGLEAAVELIQPMLGEERIGARLGDGDPEP